MPGIGDIFAKNSTAEQLFIWSLISQIVSAITAPAVGELQQLVSAFTPYVPLSPGEAASAVVRGFITQEQGNALAARAGVDNVTFGQMVDITGDSPPPELLAEGVRRHILAWNSSVDGLPSGNDGIRQGNLKDEWAPLYEKLAQLIPGTADIINALVKSQISEAEAQIRYAEAGGDPTWFATDYSANGEPPAPGQLGEMVHRGLIPWTGTGPDVLSFEQGLREGHTKNKWITLLHDITTYLPPPRTVTAMYHSGQLDHATAAELLTKYGLPADLAAAYLAPKTATGSVAEKHLAKSDILSLYDDKLLTRAQAVAGLVSLHYSSPDAEQLIELQDLKTATAQLKAGVGHVRTLYQAHKLTELESVHALESLEIPAAQAADILAAWRVTDVTTVKLLTEAQIVDAWHLSLISPDTAITKLMGRGYDEVDAWLLLAIKGKGSVPGIPKPAGA